MTFVQNFDSWEEAMAQIRANEIAAFSRMTEEQAAITYGDCFLHFHALPEGVLPIFGIVVPLDATIASELFGITSFSDEHEAVRNHARRLLETFDDELLMRFMTWRDDDPRWCMDAAEAFVRHAYDNDKHGFMDDSFDRGYEEGVLPGEEFLYFWERHRQSWDMGHRFSRCYSMVVPDGELGDKHAVTMNPITEEQFEDAATAGWVMQELIDPESLYYKPWAAELHERAKEGQAVVY